MKQGLSPRIMKKLLQTSENNLGKTRRSHERIYEALANHDKANAVEAVEFHFDEMERLFQIS